jgi:hypothetical protein
VKRQDGKQPVSIKNIGIAILDFKGGAMLIFAGWICVLAAGIARKY